MASIPSDNHQSSRHLASQRLFLEWEPPSGGHRISCSLTVFLINQVSIIISIFHYVEHVCAQHMFHLCWNSITHSKPVVTSFQLKCLKLTLWDSLFWWREDKVIKRVANRKKFGVFLCLFGQSEEKIHIWCILVLDISILCPTNNIKSYLHLYLLFFRLIEYHGCTTKWTCCNI